MATYIGMFGRLTWAQHDNFGTFGYDMGLYDQGIWLLSRFKDPFVTIRGLHFFQHHVNLITVLFVPAYWLGAGPHFLYLVETVWMALGAVPLYLLARDRLEAAGWRWPWPAASCCTRRWSGSTGGTSTPTRWSSRRCCSPGGWPPGGAGAGSRWRSGSRWPARRTRPWP